MPEERSKPAVCPTGDTFNLISPGEVSLAPEWRAKIEQQPTITEDGKVHTAAICAIQKWELCYLEEWVDYHIALGFQTIFIYDNSDDFELQGWYSKKFHNGTDHVKIVHWPGGAQQISAYNNCMKEIQKRKTHSWIAFIDIDEFFVIKDTKKHPFIMDVLDSIPESAGGLAANWLFFGWNNQTKYEPKPVSLRFTSFQQNKYVKVVARTDRVRSFHKHIHNVGYVESNFSTVDTDGKRVTSMYNERMTADVVAINHYGTRSLEEYKLRCMRGKSDETRQQTDRSYDPCQSDEKILEKWGKGLYGSHWLPSSIARDSKGKRVRTWQFDDSVWKLLKERVHPYSKYETSEKEVVGGALKKRSSEKYFEAETNQFDAANAVVTQHQQEDEPKAKATIAYAVSLTSCGSTPHGAAVLAHSIHLSSIRNFAQSGSYYDYKLIVFVHPDAQGCADIFKEFGYEIQIRDTPFQVADMKNSWLQKRIVKSGCCGEKEYLKLYSYVQFDYPVVVHLDLDSLILKPMDHLFDVMLGDKESIGMEGLESARKKISVMHDEPLPQSGSFDAYFTRDYNMVKPGHKHVGVQGGFLIVRPSQAAFDEYIQIVLEGNYNERSGWGKKGYGGYYGAQQIQGICSYFYDDKHPGTGVELNKCYYNAMADPPRQKRSGRCRDGRQECQDCRDVPLEEIYSLHFTECHKPWICPRFGTSSGQDICQKFHGEWYRIREDLERVRALERQREYVQPNGGHMPEIFRGYCNSYSPKGYIPLLSTTSIKRSFLRTWIPTWMLG